MPEDNRPVHKILQEHRCFCRHTPMLGMVVRLPDGKIVYNIRVYKSNRLYGEVYIESGKSRVRCRECNRLHTIRFVKEQPVIESAP